MRVQYRVNRCPVRDLSSNKMHDRRTNNGKKKTSTRVVKQGYPMKQKKKQRENKTGTIQKPEKAEQKYYWKIKVNKAPGLHRTKWRLQMQNPNYSDAVRIKQQMWKVECDQVTSNRCVAISLVCSMRSHPLRCMCVCVWSGRCVCFCFFPAPPSNCSFYSFVLLDCRFFFGIRIRHSFKVAMRVVSIWDAFFSSFVLLVIYALLFAMLTIPFRSCNCKLFFL